MLLRVFIISYNVLGWKVQWNHKHWRYEYCDKPSHPLSLLPREWEWRADATTVRLQTGYLRKLALSTAITRRSPGLPGQPLCSDSRLRGSHGSVISKASTTPRPVLSIPPLLLFLALIPVWRTFAYFIMMLMSLIKSTLQLSEQGLAHSRGSIHICWVMHIKQADERIGGARCQSRSLQAFSVKGQMVNRLNFAGHKQSLSSILLLCLFK